MREGSAQFSTGCGQSLVAGCTRGDYPGRWRAAAAGYRDSSVRTGEGRAAPTAEGFSAISRAIYAPGMTTIASTYESPWQPRSHSLAGQSATIIQRDGSRRAIRFASDVQFHHIGATPILQPVIEGHVDAGGEAFCPEDRELVLGDGMVFRIFIAQQSFFFAIAPLSSCLRPGAAA